NRFNYGNDLMLSKTGFTHSDLLCWQSDYAGGSLNVNGTIMRDTYITTPIHSEIVKFIDFINVSHFRHNYISIHFHNKPDHESICALY
ncbi:hypothetical protein MMO53_03615, partial [Klebsiella quasipneumoniae]|uniref:hypothetical protein n=2 Tax=Klebsiella TaxID=570 RepID=UPI002A016760|nr:hypothetical protein [Klebsiella quasipneumoniae]MCT8892117.1 hypothetical protein [Klebsiella quasipneumoniae subsp. similipneumoniae]